MHIDDRTLADLLGGVIEAQAVIISEKYRYVFIEVPHTATTAISHELITHYAGKRILNKHANYTEFRSHASKTERSYFVFAGVRNPLDVVVTDYFKYCTNHKGAFTDLEGRGKWVDDDHLERFEFVSNHGNFADFLRKFHKSIYHNWFLICRRRFNVVMRYENIAADFQSVLNELRIAPERDLPVANKSSRPNDFVELYTPDVIPLAVRTFGPFMKQWGYALPPSWPHCRVARRWQVAYQMKEMMVSAVATMTPLNGRNPRIRRIKQLIDKMS